MSDQEIQEELPLRTRIKRNPRPALIWIVGIALLLSVEIGAIIQLLIEIVPGNPFVGTFLNDLPTLLSRELIPNNGYLLPGKGWQETFLGLPPAYAWFTRFILVYLYAFVWLGWIWFGYNVYCEYYRFADWTPRDDMVNRFRKHKWGLFGFAVVFIFLVMAIFAPALGPSTFDQSIKNPYGHTMKFYDEDADSVQNITVGAANLGARSQGTGKNNVGPLSYDGFGRFHPLGTLPTGKDLLTFLVYGSRVSLFIGVIAIGVSAVLAVGFGLLTAYYKGLSDLVLIVVGDSIMSIPRLMLVILLTVVLGETWIASIYSKALLLALIFAATGWPFLWRAIRGPAFQVSEEEWIDAAKSYGQRPHVTMQKHMLPYIIGYLLVYASMWLGGVIIAVAGLSFLGFGINPPTPEWGRAIAAGQRYVASPSWHISLISGFAVVIVVTGFNALGDGIRDAIDPQSQQSEEGAMEAKAGGGA